MRAFNQPGAAHYCSSYANISGDSEGSLEAFRDKHFPKSVGTIKEGTPDFDAFRACSLRDVERDLFLAASHYRRLLDNLVPSASHWALVTAYYGSWYSSRAILGLFGCSIFKDGIVDVSRSSPGSQQLSVGVAKSKYRGLHQRYWDWFYDTATHIAPLTPKPLRHALFPVSGNTTWLIETRNEHNYDPYLALKLAEGFQTSFSATGFPSTLPGALGTHYGVLESLLEIAFHFARQFGLATDSLSKVGTAGARHLKIDELVYKAAATPLVHLSRQHITTTA